MALPISNERMAPGAEDFRKKISKEPRREPEVNAEREGGGIMFREREKKYNSLDGRGGKKGRNSSHLLIEEKKNTERGILGPWSSWGVTSYWELICIEVGGGGTLQRHCVV